MLQDSEEKDKMSTDSGGSFQDIREGIRDALSEMLSVMGEH